jgi:threonyl-tRNA synthetase
MLVVGDREAETGSVALRRHREGDEGTFSLDEVVARLTGEVASRHADRYAERR